MRDTAVGPFDLWIQAASGGESMLTSMVVEGLTTLLANNKKFRILLSSGTKQGIDSLTRGCDTLPSGKNLDITVCYFPFDAPCLMEKAFSQFSPKLAVIVETELWPGFLITAKKNNIPVLLINGRMSEKSFGSYKYFSNFFKKYGPKKVLAISPLDRERFSRIVGPDKVSLISNIKFDRIVPPKELPIHNPIHDILSKGSPFLLLGSIRKEEEEKILTTIVHIQKVRPGLTIGLFPKHIERADTWIQLLTKARITAVKRSATKVCQPPGVVIVWDIFGELAGAYALAKAAFVGGSLENLGGQNFLEPLVFGLKPIIGPYWKNFAWVGRDILASGLVREVRDEKELVTELLKAIDTDVRKEKVISQVHDFFQPRKGGTQQVCQQIIELIDNSEKESV